LNVKLSLLDDFSKARNEAATYYDLRLSEIKGVVIPKRQENSTHVFHQYTLKVPADKRDDLQAYLQEKGIPTMIYYPLPLYKQKAFENFIVNNKVELTNTEELCKTVISLPMHSNLENDQLDFICDQIKLFFSK
jgi:dTDP-4-amino-4,6-dideoxygalactose transaminase